MDARLARFAQVLVEYSLEVQSGQVVAIQGTSVASELLREIYREVIKRGAHPVPLVALSGADEIMLKQGADEQLRFITPVQRWVAEQADATISVLSDTNTRRLSNVDPGRQRIVSEARTELMQTFMRRAAQGELNWCATLFPTEAYAQDAEMSLAEYEEFVFGAGKLDAENPVAEWEQQSARQQDLIDWLSARDEVHIVGPDTNLRVRTGGRTWINADGKRNFPDGEIFTGPIEDSVNGTVRFSYPAIIAGREVDDVRLRFENGVVVEASAGKNQTFLEQMLSMDEGAKRLGEFAFGTNFEITQFTRNILFDEKIGGTIHMALGAGYPDSGSQNQSGLHWDMICDLRAGGEVRVDGELFMKDGEFVV